MKVEFVSASVSDASGGVGLVMKELAHHISLTKNINFRLSTLDSDQDSEKIFETVRQYKTFGPKIIGWSPTLIEASTKNFEIDLVHQHGVWMAVSIYGTQLKSRLEKPYIISPHGMMDPWILSRSKLKKLLAKIVYEDKSWKTCSAFHALNLNEADSINKLVKNKVIYTIPNGIFVSEDNRPTLEKKSDIPKILFIGRLHEKKNIFSLIDACCAISESDFRKNPFELVVAGWGDPSSEKTIREMVGLSQGRVRFVGSVFGEQKENLFKECDYFILPSFSEGLPMAVLEAWSYGLVVVMSEYCNLHESFSCSAAIRTPTDIEGMKKVLLEISKMELKDWFEIANNGFEYALSNYSWDVVSGMYEEMYSEIYRNG